MEHTRIALLRGVNVGGHGKLPMADLRRIATDLGLDAVQTYIQSGNLIFRTTRPPDAVAGALEEAIRAEAGVTTRVAIRTAAALAKVVADNPFLARGVDPAQLHASFLFEGDAEALAAIDGLAERLAPEEPVLGPGVAYLRAPSGLGRSNLGKLPKAHSGTTRNWRTVTRLLAMAAG
jgi:uncharacterized protein (DUF1697 family)